LRKLISYFVRNPLMGNTLMVLLLLSGVFGYFQLHSSLYPELDPRLITIQTVFPGASPQEIEEGIVNKIEQNLIGISGIEHVTSHAYENAGIVSVELSDGIDDKLLLQEVNNAVSQINSFPAQMEKPVIALAEFQSFAMDFALTSTGSLFDLKTKALEIKSALLALGEISKIELIGMPKEQFEISLQEEALRRFNVSFAEIESATRQTNIDITGGMIKTDEKDFLIRAKNKGKTVVELENIIIKSSPNGGSISLKTVADVKKKWEENTQLVYFDGRAAIQFRIRNTIQEDVLVITEKLTEFIANFNQKHQVFQITIIKDGSDELKERLQLLSKNGFYGFILVVIMLALFLHWRLAFWVGWAIPICFCGMTFWAVYAGVTINLFALFGMIIVIGILVDDGIVIAENIYQKYEQGLSPEKAAIEGTVEMFPAIFGSILTTIIGFSSIFFVDGIMGQFGLDLALVVIISLIFSLIECTLILPAHIAHSKALKEGIEASNFFKKGFDSLLQFLKNRLYQPVLKLTLQFPLPVLAFCIVLLIITIGAYQGGVIRSTFFPNMPVERFFVDVKMPSGTSQSITASVLKKIEEEAVELNQEIKERQKIGNRDMFTDIIRQIGPSNTEGKLTVYILAAEERGNITARDLSGQLRDRVQLDRPVEQIQFWVRSGFGKPVDISLSHTNNQILDKAVDYLEKELKKIQELRDVNADNQKGLEEIIISLKPKGIALGFQLADVMQQIRAGFFGKEVQRLQKGEEEIKVWLRYDKSNRASSSFLSKMKIKGIDNLLVPLEEIADFSIENSITKITHYDNQRSVSVTAEIADSRVSVSQIMDAITTTIVPKLMQQFPATTISYKGEQREQDKTLSTVISSVMMMLLVIFFIIIFIFRSILQAVIVFCILPFGLVGIGLGHYLMDLPISMISLLGLGALLGILVNDALVFLITFNEKIKANIPVEQAILETGIIRFRPILLTSLTTIIGLGPILLEKSLGAQMLIPMAVSVAYGLLIVTVIVLLLIPCFLILTHRIREIILKNYNNLQGGDNVEIAIVGGYFLGIALLIAIFYLAWIIVI